MSEPDEPEIYDVDEVEAILARALKRGETRDGLSPEELREVAREVGIDDAALDEAIVEVREDRLVEAERERVTMRRRSGFGVHFFVYAVVNLALFLVARRLGIVSLLAWGIGVFFHALAALPVAKLDRARVLRKIDKRRQRRERERQAALLRDAASAGVSEVLRAATSALERERERGRRGRSRGRRDSHAGAGGVPPGGFGTPPATPPRARVDVEDAEIVEEPGTDDERLRRRR